MSNTERVDMAEPLRELNPKEENPRIAEIKNTLLDRFIKTLPDLTQDQMNRLALIVTDTAKEMQRLESLAVYDTLLHRFFRHQNFIEFLEEETSTAEAIPTGKPGSALIFADLDNFKVVNDLFGHQLGDEILRSTGNSILRSIRPGDTPGRVGGEELAIIVRRTTIEGAVAAARRIQARVGEESLKSFPEEGIRQTLSIGIALIDGRSAKSILDTADEAMYTSKANGRDRITIAQFDPTTQKYKMTPVEPLRQAGNSDKRLL